MQEILFTVKQVSELLHCNPAYVYQLINNKLLPVVKLGSYKVRKCSLEDFLEKYEGYDLSNPEDIKVLAYANENKVIEYAKKEVI
ncbi:MAG: helix-turn-helix domain-containing protein [Clostridia bacterium]|nr:helix-turn-helix domain-containing protein [Clostridia bacterium]